MLFSCTLKNNGIRPHSDSVHKLGVPDTVSSTDTGAKTVCGLTGWAISSFVRSFVKDMASKARAEPESVSGIGPPEHRPVLEKPSIIPYRRIKGDYCGIGLGSFVICRHHPSVLKVSIAVDRLVYSRAGGEQ